MTEPLDFLTRLGAEGDAQVDLAGAALALAALDRPGATPEPYLATLGRLVQDMSADARTAATALERAGALRDLLCHQHGFTGDQENYDDPDNANLMSVIERRRGLPVALSIIYIHTARTLGWPAVGLNFPAHFLIRLEGLAGDRAILDPFHDGAVLDAGGLRRLIKEIAGPAGELTPEFYQPVSDRAILVRLLNNIRSRALKAADIPRAIDCLNRLVRLEPLNAPLWYELGMLEIHRNRLVFGRNALEKCLMLLDLEHPSTDNNRDMRQRVLDTLSEVSSNLD